MHGACFTAFNLGAFGFLFQFAFFCCYCSEKKKNLQLGRTLTLLYLSVSLSFQWQIPLTLAVGNTSHISSETVIWVTKKTGKFPPDTAQMKHDTSPCYQTQRI